MTGSADRDDSSQGDANFMYIGGFMQYYGNLKSVTDDMQYSQENFQVLLLTL